MGVGSSERPPFYGSWLQGVAAILPDFFKDFKDFFRSSNSLRRFFARSSSQVAYRWDKVTKIIFFAKT
jgi:hypothetical protein